MKNNWVWIWIPLVLMAFQASPKVSPEKSNKIMSLFITPQDPQIVQTSRTFMNILKKHPTIVGQIVLLVEDFKRLDQDIHSQSFIKALQILEVDEKKSLFLFNKDGLGQAIKLKITKTPAFVIETPTAFHIGYGSTFSFEEIRSCPR